MRNLSKLFLSILFATLSIFPAKSEDSTKQPTSIFAFINNNVFFENSLKDNPHATSYVLSFYEKLKNQPIWFNQGHLTTNGKIALEVLKKSDIEGLNPLDYRDAFQIDDQPDNWINAEILLTKRFLEFINHVQNGRVSPMKISGDIKFSNPKKNPSDLLLEAINDKRNAGQRLRNMAPTIPQYNDLKNVLAYYKKQLEVIKEWPTLSGFKTFKPGDHDPEINVLRKILVLSGDLSEDKITGEIFDVDVATALRQFQKRYSLDPDGIVGRRTRIVLNYPVKEIIKKIIVNMERLRWLPPELGNKHIIVNIAGYTLHGFEDFEATIVMPIIVGRPDRRTPLFYTTLKNIVLNPLWNVPYGIYINDKLPKILKNKDYIKKNNFTVIDNKGQAVDPDLVDWENEGRRYYLRQSSGRHNALGRIKFNIENPYVIYLHGTPDQRLFSKKARAFSSGCIRLKHPKRLATWVLKNDPLWSSKNIKINMDKGETRTIPLVEEIPVYFTYQTIWIKNKNNQKRIFFSDDPYNLDTKMIKILNIQ